MLSIVATQCKSYLVLILTYVSLCESAWFDLAFEKFKLASWYVQTYVTIALQHQYPQKTVIKLLSGISTLMWLSSVLPPISWALFTSLVSKVIADFTEFFRFTHNVVIIFLDCITFTWSSIHALICNLAQLI